MCKESELHKASTIGTIFDEINEHVKEKFKLKKPIDFNYDDIDKDEEDLDVDDDLLVNAETAEDRARKFSNFNQESDEESDL